MLASVAVVEDIGTYSRSGGLSPNVHDVAGRIFNGSAKRAAWPGIEPHWEVSPLAVREWRPVRDSTVGDYAIVLYPKGPAP